MRLVTFKCPACGQATGGFVEPEAEGARDLSCEHCGTIMSVDVTRTVAAIRPTNTPAQVAEWATTRARALRATLVELLPEVEAYLRLHDMTVEELPPTSPLRAALLKARLEIAKSVP